jgi:hypothetical protein
MKPDKPIYILGDIHGNSSRLIQKIYSLDIKDCYIFCVGDLGIGFSPKGAAGEAEFCSNINSLMVERNIEFMSIRGNHDDPSYFNDETKRVWYSNFKLLPDYYVETFGSTKVLFVGGAISIDRIYRIQGKSYWKDEPFEYKPNLIQECDICITHSGPSWNGPFDKEGLSYWTQRDNALWDECLAERNGHNNLIEACRAKYHYCGHFHVSAWTHNMKTCSRILNIDELYLHNPY